MTRRVNSSTFYPEIEDITEENSFGKRIGQMHKTGCFLFLLRPRFYDNGPLS